MFRLQTLQQLGSEENRGSPIVYRPVSFSFSLRGGSFVELVTKPLVLRSPIRSPTSSSSPPVRSPPRLLMAFSSFRWPFRRRSSRSDGAGPSKPAAAEGKKEGEEEELGVTPQLLDFLRTLSPDAFKSSALQLNQGGAVEAAGELSDWQQRHAVLVLGRAKELAKIRYDLCPRHMKDKQFWTVYFMLARSYILPYELRAIQKEKVRRMETENGKPKDVITVEVEMQESKCSIESQTLPDDSEPHDS